MDLDEYCASLVAGLPDDELVKLFSEVKAEIDARIHKAHAEGRTSSLPLIDVVDYE